MCQIKFLYSCAGLHLARYFRSLFLDTMPFAEGSLFNRDFAFGSPLPASIHSAISIRNMRNRCELRAALALSYAFSRN